MMDCVLAKCIPCIIDCIMGELKKLGLKYKVALGMAQDPRFERIPCNCKGCYANDCLVKMVTQWRCFIVATCNKELRGRIRRFPVCRVCILVGIVIWWNGCRRRLVLLGRYM
eukprot:CCRYP_012292-RB/>CCRYP_012292-RB protein AED:0.24 eAED:0.21 QI:0/-1/0/1/-1/0/1/0/111